MQESSQNSRRLARTWPYPRHKRFVIQLRDAAKEWFARREYAVNPKYGYRLAEWSDWHRNIIVPEVATYVEQARQERACIGQGFALHDHVHHGLSSQAFLFNLVGPLIVEGDLEPLRHAAESSNLNWPGVSQRVTLEYEDRSVFNEDSGQPTSVDLVIGDPNSPAALFVECKLAETEFGGCSVFGDGDCDGTNPVADFARCYLHHIGRRYWSLLDKHGFLDGPISTDAMCVLGTHYQFFRLALFALERGGVFVLLSDERSPTFYYRGPEGDRGLMPALLRYVPRRLSTRIGQMSVQTVVDAIALSGRHDWIADFRSKYGMA